MTLVIGTDEAGYGPNLGPLVVAATAWRIDAGRADAERALTAALAAALADHDGPLWADSKRIHRGGAGFAAVERGALVAAALLAGHVPRSGRDLTTALGAAAIEQPPEAERFHAARLPLEADGPTCLDLAGRIRGRLAAAGAALTAIGCRIVHPAAFNRRLAEGLNKADILSATTLDLAAALAAARRDEPVLVWCDRHGGRRRYAGLVSRHFAVPLVHVVAETAVRSVYDMPAAACGVEFDVGGEERTPVALASLLAKYVRELAMRAFNAHWSSLAPGIAPTAGYPVDAARWRRQAAATVAAAGIDWDTVWRRS